MKILAVDDDTLILELLRHTVRGIGYPDVTVASSAKAAMELITDAAVPFDCFLLDVQMPDMDGIDLCRWIRKVAGYRAQPIVMITAMSAKSYVDRAFQAGATDYVTKPFDILELGTRIRLAEKQFEADRRLVETGQEVEALSVQLEDAFRTKLSDPVALDDVEGLIDLMAMENYLLQLSRGGMFSSSAIALRIAQVERLYAVSSPSLFRDILADVVGATATALRGMTYLLAHAGNGTFVAVVSQGKSLQPAEIELAINERLSNNGSVDDTGRDLDIQVNVGSPCHFGLLRSGPGAVNQMYKAIEEVQASSGIARHRTSEPKRRLGMLSALLQD